MSGEGTNTQIEDCQLTAGMCSLQDNMTLCFLGGAQGRTGIKKNCKEEVPPPGSKRPTPPPPPHPNHLKKIFFGAFGANVLCVPQCHVQGVSQLFTLNSISMKIDCNELILS